MSKYIRISLKLVIFNFVLTALLGTLMRYKIAFSFPFFNQKYLQESHNYFAFYGWVTSAIYILIFLYLQKVNPQVNSKKYWTIIASNLIASYGLLIGFMVKSFNSVSIASAVLVIVLSFFYFFSLIKDLRNVKDRTKYWFMGALFFAILSSFGFLWLSYMMLSKTTKIDTYLASTYYFLHFQYNGFFLFSCIGLLIHSLKEAQIKVSKKVNIKIFALLFSGCLIGYGLSVLWMDLPIWIYTIIIIGALLQTYGAVLLYLLVKRNWGKLKEAWTPLQRFVLIYTGFAFAVKIALQLGSVVPAISKFAFGFRNVVIAYLHLILLMCVSVFLIDQILRSNYFKQTKLMLNGFKLLMISIFLNEALLGLMGIFSIEYIAIPNSAEMLFGISFTILFASAILFSGMKSQKFIN